MKALIENVFSNVAASYIVNGLSAAGCVAAAVFKPELIPYILGMMVLVAGAIILHRLYIFGTARFQWTHVHSSDIRCFTLYPDFQAKDSECFKTECKREFEGKISGDIFGDDVEIEKISLHAEKAQLKATLKFENKAPEIYRGTDYINNDPDHPMEVNYDILFENNRPADVFIEVFMKYDVQKTSPEYYIDVSRPMRKLVLELKVKEGVRIRNVRKQITAKWGDKGQRLNKNLKGVPCKDDPTMVKYRFVTRNPQILHRYAIVWEWISVADSSAASA